MPIAQTVIRANESTGNIPADRRVRDVGPRIAYLDPDAAPFTVVLMQTRSREAINTKFEWMEKKLPARWDAVHSGRTGHSATASPIGVENAKFFSEGDVLVIPRTKERMIVTSVDTTANTLGVTRGQGILAAVTLNDDDDILIIGNAYTEGALSGTPKSHVEDFRYNYTQIVRTPFGVTGSEAVSENYTGPDRTRLQMEKGVEHKIDLERTLLFGERNIVNPTGDNPRRYTGGLLYFLEAHDLTGVPTAKLKDFGGIVTEPEIEDWTENVFAATGSGDRRLLLASPRWISIFDQLAAGRIQITNQRDTTFGITVRTWVTGHGELSIVRHRLLENNPAPVVAGAGTGFAGYALAVDMDRVTYRHLRERNTKLKENIQAPDYDGVKDEYITECGLQVELPEAHGVGYNATG